MLIKILSVVSLVLLLAGCGASKYSVPSKSSEATIVNSAEKAYVVFGSENLGGGRYDPIFEYFPENETFQLVAILHSNEEYIYPINEGVHYFYSMGGETYDFLKVEAQKGKKYFVNIETIFWTWRMTTPIAFEPTIDKDLIEDINEKNLVTNSQEAQEWYEKRKDNPQFKAKVKIRFTRWKESEMQNKTMYAKDGFPIK